MRGFLRRFGRATEMSNPVEAGSMPFHTGQPVFRAPPPDVRSDIRGGFNALSWSPVALLGTACGLPAALSVMFEGERQRQGIDVVVASR